MKPTDIETMVLENWCTAFDALIAYRIYGASGAIGCLVRYALRQNYVDATREVYAYLKRHCERDEIRTGDQIIWADSEGIVRLHNFDANYNTLFRRWVPSAN